MKTPQELLTKTYSRKNHGTNSYLKPRNYFVDYDDAVRGMKEYAKQWIDKAATIGRMYAGLNSANAIEDLKSKIDAQ